MVIKWSDFAQENLHDFKEHSKLSSPSSYIEELVHSVSILEDFPKAGKFKFYYEKNRSKTISSPNAQNHLSRI